MIKVNLEKAVRITKNRLRMWRDSEFQKNDVKLQNALADGDEVAKQDAIKHREYLRDLPDQAEGKTLEELKDMLKNIESLNQRTES